MAPTTTRSAAFSRSSPRGTFKDTFRVPGHNSIHWMTIAVKQVPQ
jgi:hypothetical protein